MFQDLFHLADTGLGDVQVFHANTAATFQTWRKPKGCSMVGMWLLSGGGGGGAGFSRSAGSAGGGGGGGGCSGLGRLLIPALLLPDILFLAIGVGGVGGQNGTNSCISMQPTVQSNFALLLGSTAAGLGGTGSGAAAGTGGVAGTMNVSSLGITMGIISTSNGSTGSAGGAQTGAIGTAVTLLVASNNPLSSQGAGGAGCTTTDFAGGPLTSPDPTILASIPGGLAAGGAGRPGVQLPGFFAFTGGAGGGSNNSGVGGAGGNGMYGCGGGGGGAGVTGGAGGRGGNGLAVMVAL